MKKNNKEIRKQEIKQKLREIADSINIVESELPNEYNEFADLGLVKDGIYKKIEIALEILTNNLYDFGRFSEEIEKILANNK